MKRVLVVYGANQGHIGGIVEAVVGSLEANGLTPRMIDLSRAADEDGVDDCDATIVVASVHRGRSDPALTGFVMRHGPMIRSHPSAFLSVSLSAASHNPDEQDALDELARHFLFDLGWEPDAVQHIAGAVLDSQLEILSELSERPGQSAMAAPIKVNGYGLKNGKAQSEDPSLAALLASVDDPDFLPSEKPAPSALSDLTDWTMLERFVRRFSKMMMQVHSAQTS